MGQRALAPQPCLSGVCSELREEGAPGPLSMFAGKASLGCMFGKGHVIEVDNFLVSVLHD